MTTILNHDRGKHVSLEFAMTLVRRLVCVLILVVGCRQSEQWTTPPSIVHGVVEGVEVNINDTPISDNDIVAKSGGQVRLAVKFLRSLNGGADFEYVGAFIVKADQRGLICTVKECFLGSVDVDRQAGKRRIWASRNEKNGTVGIPVNLNLAAGNYEVWICLCRSPTSAREFRSNDQNPWAFRTAVHKCNLRLN